MTGYAEWPFRPLAARSIEESERWRQTCYLPSEASRIVAGWPHWRIITGGPGSGKSVALAEVEQQETGRSLVVQYPSERWPGARHAFVKEGNHLAQIMAAAGLALRERLTQAPGDVTLLSNSQCTALRWMLDKFAGPRTFARWVDSLPAEFAGQLHSVGYEDLYASTTDVKDVYAQVDELVSVARRLGYERVLVSIDLNTSEAEANLGRLGELFDWFEMMHQAGLSLIAALPRQVVDISGLIARTRSRVSVALIDWSVEQMREIAARHLRAATRDAVVELESLTDAALLTELEQTLQKEFGGIAPQGWVMLVETLLYLANQASQPVLPFTLDRKADILRAYFVRHIPLRLEPGKGVWRGPRLIPLDSQPLSLLEVLWTKGNTPSNIDDEEMRQVARTKGNLHTLIRRIRRAIEPIKGQSVYLFNDRGEGGYWLENTEKTRLTAAM